MPYIQTPSTVCMHNSSEPFLSMLIKPLRKQKWVATIGHGKVQTKSEFYYMNAHYLIHDIMTNIMIYDVMIHV